MPFFPILMLALNFNKSPSPHQHLNAIGCCHLICQLAVVLTSNWILYLIKANEYICWEVCHTDICSHQINSHWWSSKVSQTTSRINDQYTVSLSMFTSRILALWQNAVWFLKLYLSCILKLTEWRFNFLYDVIWSDLTDTKWEENQWKINQAHTVSPAKQSTVEFLGRSRDLCCLRCGNAPLTRIFCLFVCLFLWRSVVRKWVFHGTF